MKKILILILFACNFPAIYAQIVYPAGEYIVDENNKLIICNRQPGIITPGAGTIELDRIYHFDPEVQGLSVGTEYQITTNGDIYRLYFSLLPLINIEINDTIGADRETIGTIEVSDTMNTSSLSNMGIRIRGATSAFFPKKGYRVQIKNEHGSNKDTTFFGLREDKRWLLLAMWNEKLRLNNIVSHNLWADMHTLHYADREPNALPAIRLLYVEVFINKEYQGVYLFTEDMDRKQLQLKKNQGTTIRGELYKGDYWGGACTFESLPVLPLSESEIWGGWEYKYPDTFDWSNLYAFTDFVINAPADDFRNQIASKLDINSAMDYFIFMNLLRASDNRGKNLFLARYDTDDPYFFAPWDLDGTWGYDYMGERSTIFTEILSNGLYQRLLSINPDNFKKRLSDRWFDLRAGILSNPGLKANITHYRDLLMQNGVYEREKLVWDNPLLSFDQTELDYMLIWLDSRIDFLDLYFTDLGLTVTEKSPLQDRLMISPNPTSGILHINLLHIADSYNVQITDITGKLLLPARKLNYGSNQLDITNFPSGLYLLSFSDNRNGWVTKKIIKAN
jgi:spore coat protein H